jgi:hypothetical protein
VKFKYKTLKSYIGAKCRQEGGKSEAKIHDALQIANLIADDLFQYYNSSSIETPKDSAAIEVVNVADLFIKTGARRYLKRMKGKKK